MANWLRIQRSDIAWTSPTPPRSRRGSSKARSSQAGEYNNTAFVAEHLEKDEQ
jgi:hypothetical protein